MLIVNGTTIENVVYNGQDLDKLIYNDVVVFEKSGFNAEQVLIDFDYIRNSDGTYTITDWKGTYQGQESTECIVPNKKEIRLYTKTITSSIENEYEIISSQEPLNLTFQMYNFTQKDFEALKINIVIEKTDVISYLDYAFLEVSNSLTNLIIPIQALQYGTSNIKITLTSNKHIYSKQIKITVPEPRYEVESISGVTYGFVLNSNGYYESTNKGRDSTYAMCKVKIINPFGKNVYFDCIQTSEDGYDYGMLSKLNTPFSKNITADTNNAYVSLQSWYSPYDKVISYGPVSGDIYVKYRKDGSSSIGNDSLQFKVRIE